MMSAYTSSAKMERFAVIQSADAAATMETTAIVSRIAML